MNRRFSHQNKAVQRLYDLLVVDTIGKNPLVIVNGTILHQVIRVLASAPQETLETLARGDQKFFESEPTLPLSTLLRAARAQLGGISQRHLSDLLRQRGLKVWGSDIGNLETGKRESHYLPERREKIREATLQLLEDNQTKLR